MSRGEIGDPNAVGYGNSADAEVSDDPDAENLDEQK